MFLRSFKGFVERWTQNRSKSELIGLIRNKALSENEGGTTGVIRLEQWLRASRDILGVSDEKKKQFFSFLFGISLASLVSIFIFFVFLFPVSGASDLGGDETAEHLIVLKKEKKTIKKIKRGLIDLENKHSKLLEDHKLLREQMIPLKEISLQYSDLKNLYGVLRAELVGLEEVRGKIEEHEEDIKRNRKNTVRLGMKVVRLLSQEGRQ